MPAKKLKTINTAVGVKSPAKEGILPKKVIQDAVNAVAEKATNVAKKATPKKPTSKQLQDQYDAAIVTIDNLNEQLDLKNNLIRSLEQDIHFLKENELILEREVKILNASVRYRDELIDRLETPWWKRALNLFGN